MRFALALKARSELPARYETGSVSENARLYLGD